MIGIMWLTHSLFDASNERDYSAGDRVFSSGARVDKVFLVRSGQTALVRLLPSGHQVVLHRSHRGELVAEASIYAQNYHCECIAMEQTRLATVSKESFLQTLREDAILSEAWAAHLARSVQRARMRAEIRSLKTVSERLDAWCAEYGEIPEKGLWQTLADEISVSREALYRELAKRRQ